MMDGWEKRVVGRSLYLHPSYLSLFISARAAKVCICSMISHNNTANYSSYQPLCVQPLFLSLYSILPGWSGENLKLSYQNRTGKWADCMTGTREGRGTLVCPNNLTPIVSKLKLENTGTLDLLIKDIKIYGAGM